ncbi:Aspartic proteinase nepenthesin-2 [Morus notabilis]|uniref:Aspartic proteinase nepenthesin-2 n=1 Tax=Morus notabilis TaxID=981085 RepID=W9R0A8_9ROSA|nr:Aspartic proteinase nepenthesin-2 [Morus notabilis]
MTVARLICLEILFLHLLILLLLVYNNNFLNHKPSGFSLKLIPRGSPDSPFRPEKLTERQRIQRIAEVSRTRAYTHLRNSSPSSTPKITNISPTLDTENFHLQILKKDFFYTVQVFIGTPRAPQTLLMDTGSGLIWTQCKPCKNCFSQTKNIPIFTPNVSTSYKRLPCNHQLCLESHQCVDGKCVYSQGYAGGSVTNGVVSQETFSFPSNNNGGFRAVENVVFGCSNDNKNYMFNSISGILGLSYSPDSLVSQLGNSVKKRFSYCLPYSYSPMMVNTVLRFGNDIKKSPLAKTTSFVQKSNGTQLHHYYLNLVDISVQGRRLGLPPGTFALSQNGKGGCVIDSGSVLSFLDDKAYNVVMAEFESYFRRLGLERARNLTVGFEYCYRLEKKINDHDDFGGYADLTFHFEGADFLVEPKYMYFYNRRGKYFCVALMAFPGKTIIGAWQQQNTRFVYDLNLHQLQFAPEDCAKDQIP